MKTLRTFSAIGPCITEGELVGETAKFWLYKQAWGDGKVRKMKKGRPHIEPCGSCRDHPQTQYPNGYMD
jgi:hypothetical protein